MSERYCAKHDRPADDPVCSACVDEEVRRLSGQIQEIEKSRDQLADDFKEILTALHIMIEYAAPIAWGAQRASENDGPYGPEDYIDYSDYMELMRAYTAVQNVKEKMQEIGYKIDQELWDNLSADAEIPF